MPSTVSLCFTTYVGTALGPAAEPGYSLVPSRAPYMTLSMDVQAPSAADSVAVIASDRDQPAHREGMRGAVFIEVLYCITIPAGIRRNAISSRLRLTSATAGDRRGLPPARSGLLPSYTRSRRIAANRRSSGR